MKKRHKDLDYENFDMNNKVVQKKNKKEGNVEHFIMQQISEDQMDAITLNNVKRNRNLKEKYFERNNLNLKYDVSLIKVKEEPESENELSQGISSFNCEKENREKEIETINVNLLTIFKVKIEDVDLENNNFDMNDTVAQKKKKKHKENDIESDDLDVYDTVVEKKKKKHKRKDSDNNFDMSGEGVQKNEEKEGNDEHFFMQKITEQQTDAIAVNNVKKKNSKKKYLRENHFDLKDKTSPIKVREEELVYENLFGQEIVETSKKKAKKHKSHKKNSSFNIFNSGDESLEKEITAVDEDLSKHKDKNLDYDLDVIDKLVRKKKKHKRKDSDNNVDMSGEAVQKNKEKEGNDEYLFMQQITEQQTDAINVSNIKKKRKLKEKYFPENNLDLKNNVSPIKVREEEPVYENLFGQEIVGTSKNKVKKHKGHEKKSNHFFNSEDKIGGKEIVVNEDSFTNVTRKSLPLGERKIPTLNNLEILQNLSPGVSRFQQSSSDCTFLEKDIYKKTKQRITPSHDAPNILAIKDIESMSKTASYTNDKSKLRYHEYTSEDELAKDNVFSKTSSNYTLDLKPEPVDFSVPLLHSDEKAIMLTPKRKAFLEENNVSIASGRWSKEEDAILRRNYQEFGEKFFINDPYLLLGIGRHARSMDVGKFLKAKHFFVRLGKDLNNRSLRSIYVRARALFNPLQTKEKFSKQKIADLKHVHNIFGRKWSAIGSILDKSDGSCCASYMWHNKEVNKGKWTTEEESNLINAIKTVTNTEDISSNNIQTLSWEHVARLVPTRNKFQCRHYWADHLAWDPNVTERKRWNLHSYAKLIHLLKNDYFVSTEKEINWKELHKHFIDVAPSHFFLRKKWTYLKQFLPKLENLKYLKILDLFWEKYKNYM
ncbi:transcription termination factor 1 [Nephila pilipes]|uniref:Transcription termination factor 1 n=1 Tax=Nephila pilipes TaxID=299642 RepID=A0A8X6UJ60_NEPPI|nr:transcription termination factor 1 [Nephila pilipes]